MTDASAPRKRVQAQAQPQAATSSAAQSAGPSSSTGSSGSSGSGTQAAAGASAGSAAGSGAGGAGRTKARRGFAVMDKNRQREIASAGGRAAHARGNAHEFTSDEAREAGRKGGRSVSNNKDHMADIGRKGGIERGKRHAQRVAQKKNGAATAHGDSTYKAPRRPHAAESAHAAG